jgi:hypothetical protein
MNLEKIKRDLEDQMEARLVRHGQMRSRYVSIILFLGSPEGVIKTGSRREERA